MCYWCRHALLKWLTAAQTDAHRWEKLPVIVIISKEPLLQEPKAPIVSMFPRAGVRLPVKVCVCPINVCVYLRIWLFACKSVCIYLLKLRVWVMKLCLYLCCVRVYLVNLVPAVLVLAADHSLVFQEELTAAGVASHHRTVIQRRQTTTVFVVRRGSQLQQGLTPIQSQIKPLRLHGYGCFIAYGDAASDTVRETRFLERAALWRAVNPSLALKSRWAPPLFRTLMISTTLSR